MHGRHDQGGIRPLAPAWASTGRCMRAEAERRGRELGDEGDASVPTEIGVQSLLQHIPGELGDEGDASVPTEIGVQSLLQHIPGELGDEGDASVPTLPRVRPRPYGNGGPRAAQEKPPCDSPAWASKGGYDGN
jgi:hypothetical protein